MWITGFAAGVFRTNCFLAAAGAGSDAVIIDPGQDALDDIAALVARHRLAPVAILLTHGHLDHTWSAAEVARRYEIPTYIHPLDRPMLEDPGIGIGPELAAMLDFISYRAPADIREFTGGQVLDLAGIEFGVSHAPGHTEGSVLLSTLVQGPGAEVVFSGDVLFAGAIGRTDLPGGSHEMLLDSIDTHLLAMPDTTTVLPGHGPQTTIGAERASNPFLAGREARIVPARAAVVERLGE